MSVYNYIQIKQLSSEIIFHTEWYNSFNIHQLSLDITSPLAHTNTSKQSKDHVLFTYFSVCIKLRADSWLPMAKKSKH